MKKLIFQSIIALTFFAALMLPAAQAEPRMIFRGNVPFNFVVSEKHFPAGQYEVTPYVNTNLVLIQNTDSRSAAFAPTIGVQAPSSPKVGTLVFHRYGDQYFLSSIRAVGTDTARELLKSRLESEVARSTAEPGTTVVAAHSNRK